LLYPNIFAQSLHLHLKRPAAALLSQQGSAATATMHHLSRHLVLLAALGASPVSAELSLTFVLAEVFPGLRSLDIKTNLKKQDLDLQWSVSRDGTSGTGPSPFRCD